MMWTKLGDEAPDEYADLSDAAFRVHVEALCWSNRRLLDLRIPKRDLRRFAFSDEAEQAVKELVECSFWIDDGDAWHLAHRPEWQQSRDQVEHRRAQNAIAQERRRRHARSDHSLCIPDRCKALSPADTPDDALADSAPEYGSDPGRDGSGRDWVTSTTNYSSKRDDE